MTTTLNIKVMQDGRQAQAELPTDAKEAWKTVYYAVSDMWNSKAPYGIDADSDLEWTTSDGRSGVGKFWELPSKISGF